MLQKLFTNPFFIITGGMVMIVLIQFLIRLSESRKNMNRRFLLRLMMLVVFFGCILNLFKVWDPSLDIGSILLKGSALIVAIVGFAAQTAISDIICGFLISMNKPFEIGDRIVIEGLEPGIVEDLTLRHVVISIYDDLKIIVPNSQLNTKTVINTSYRKDDKRGIHLQFSVSYDTDIQKAIDAIRDCVSESPYTLGVERNGIKEDSGPVYFLKYAESALILETTLWITKATSTYTAITDVNTRVKNTFQNRGIEIPYSYLNVVEYEGIKAAPSAEPEKKKEKDDPSKRLFRTNTLRFKTENVNMEKAMETVHLFSRRQRLDVRKTRQMELLTEESIGIIKNIVSDAKVSFWIEGSGLIYRIHLAFSARIGSEEYKKLLSLSSSGRNEAARAFPGRLWEIIVRGIDSQTDDRQEKSSYEWNLSEETVSAEQIGEFILAAIADDIKVSVRKDKVELLVIKSTV